MIEASGGPADATAAEADAQKVIDLHPFAAVGGPDADAGVLAGDGRRRDHLCRRLRAESCDQVEAAAPYLWPTGPNPEQADAHLVELVGKQLVGKNAEFGGDDACRAGARLRMGPGRNRDRRVQGAQRRVRPARGRVRRRDRDPVHLPVRHANVAEIATTAIARMKDAGVTTIMLSTDPLIPATSPRKRRRRTTSPSG